MGVNMSSYSCDGGGPEQGTQEGNILSQPSLLVPLCVRYRTLRPFVYTPLIWSGFFPPNEKHTDRKWLWKSYWVPAQFLFFLFFFLSENMSLAIGNVLLTPSTMDIWNIWTVSNLTIKTVRILRGLKQPVCFRLAFLYHGSRNCIRLLLAHTFQIYVHFKF